MYGYIEKLQLNEIDQIKNEEFKPFRRNFVQKCNQILDFLEDKQNIFLNENEINEHIFIIFPHSIYSFIIISSDLILELGYSTIKSAEYNFEQIIELLFLQQNKLLTDGFIEFPSKTIHFYGSLMTISNYNQINHLIKLNQKFKETICQIHHIHEFGLRSIQHNIQHFIQDIPQDLSQNSFYQIFISDIQGGFSFSIIEFSQSNISQIFFHEVYITNPLIAIQRINIDLISSTINFTFPILSVWFIGLNRQKLSEVLTQHLHHLNILNFYSSYSIHLQNIFPYTIEGEIKETFYHLINFQYPLFLSSIGVTSSLNQLQSSQSQSQSITSQKKDFIPFLYPYTSLPFSQTRKIQTFLHQSQFQNIESLENIYIHLDIVEKFFNKNDKELKEYLSFILSLPKNIVPIMNDGYLGPINLELTVSTSFDRTISIIISILKSNNLNDTNEILTSFSYSPHQHENTQQINTQYGNFSIILNSSQLTTLNNCEIVKCCWICPELSLILKNRGNDFMTQGNFELAIEMYSNAINCESQNGVLYSNRCAALTKLGRYSEALNDSETCVRLLPHWEKGWSRRGGILLRIGKLEEAVHSYEKG